MPKESAVYTNLPYRCNLPLLCGRWNNDSCCECSLRVPLARLLSSAWFDPITLDHMFSVVFHCILFSFFPLNALCSFFALAARFLSEYQAHSHSMVRQDIQQVILQNP